MVFKDTGLVLRETKSGESDKMLTVLLKGRKKTSVYARGARKPTSKFAAATALFSYCDFVLNEKNGFVMLSSADIIAPFMGIRADYDAFCAASFIAELIDKTIMPNMETEYVIELCAACFAALNRGENADYVKSAFSLRFLNAEGFVPTISSYGVSLSYNGRKAAEYILNADLGVLFDHVFDTDVINALISICGEIIRKNLEITFKSDHIQQFHV